MYGKPPPPISTYLKGSSTVEAVDHLLSTRQDLWAALTTRLHKMLLAMKAQADNKHRNVLYMVGDWVYVKLQPYRQTSFSHTSFNKLSKPYYEPFQISETIGAVAYRLALPESSKIHNVFHCSMLKPHHDPIDDVTDPLLPQATDNHPLVEPLSILDTKWDDTTSPPSLLVLVQWSGLAPEETSWEHWEELCATYHLKDKVVLPTVGINGTQQLRPKRKALRPVYL